jgi:putative FmdB family regulatory protein
MPTYEYACAACGDAWEVEQRITEPALKKCPACGKNAAKRQISGGGTFILKGSGWYADGYSSSSKPSSVPSKCDGKCETCDVKTTPADVGKGADGASKKPAPASKKATGAKASAV